MSQWPEVDPELVFQLDAHVEVSNNIHACVGITWIVHKLADDAITASFKSRSSIDRITTFRFEVGDVVVRPRQITLGSTVVRLLFRKLLEQFMRTFEVGDGLQSCSRDVSLLRDDLVEGEAEIPVRERHVSPEPRCGGMKQEIVLQYLHGTLRHLEALIKVADLYA